MATRSRFYHPQAFPLFEYLDEFCSILGNTNRSLFPLLTNSGEVMSAYGASSAVSGLASTTALNAAGAGAHDPHRHNSGIHSLQIDGTAAADLIQAADGAQYTFGNGTVDSPFSVGACILMHEAVGTVRSILSKYRTTAATAREWDFRFSATGKLELELYDESAAASEIATSAGTALIPFKWQCVVATYDGGETSPVINLYIDGASVHDGTSTETGAYVAMEDLTSPVGVGCRNTTAPAQVFQGRIALPFITGKALSAAEVAELGDIANILLGAV